ncbi:FtsK/SpoIIIE domain-containing protein [Corynebacterium glyciniphilum]|uniref:FtsK/SpoIIIE domain-containing protein n=1 Tax=Corynebacterium glyciniphilum TaxID=1404244 RepID=UPI003DA0DC7B
MTSYQAVLSEHGHWIGWDATSGHALVTGQTGSGKSASLYDLLCIASHDPQTQVVGIDPSGVTGAPFARVHPRDWVVGGADIGVQAIELLEAVVAEMDRRTRALGRMDLDKLPDHLLGRKLFAIRVVLEEYTALLSAVSRKQKDEITTLVGRILREGRKARINVLTVVQRPEAAVLHDRGQYQDLFLHLLENRTSVEMVLNDADEEVVKMLTTLSPGEGGYKRIGPKPIARFRSPLMEFSEYSARVKNFLRTPPFRK